LRISILFPLNREHVNYIQSLACTISDRTLPNSKPACIDETSDTRQSQSDSDLLAHARVGAVHHCHSHCLTVLWRIPCFDVWGKVQYTSAIGWKIPVTFVTKLGSHKSAGFSANHRGAFSSLHQIAKFRQTTVNSVNDSGWLLPPMDQPQPSVYIWTNRIEEKALGPDLTPKLVVLSRNA